MQEVLIKQHLQEVLESVVALLSPQRRVEAAKQIYLAGGAIASLVLDEKPQDYDIFVETPEVANWFRECVASTVPSRDMEVLARTENGLTFQLRSGEVVQVVTRFTGPPNRVFESFDYKHTQCYFKPQAYYEALQTHTVAELVYDRELILSKRLVFDGRKEEFALNTLKRLAKFVHRGWTPDNASIVNLYRAIQKAPPIDDPVEHAKQVIGFYGSSFT